MQKLSAKPSRIALGFTLLGALTLGGLGCGGGGTSHPDAGKDTKADATDTDAAGTDATGAAGATDGPDAAAGKDGAAGATSMAGHDGGAGAAGSDGGAGATGGAGAAGNDGGAGAAGNDGGADAAAGNDGGADAAAGSDGGVSDAGDGGDAADVPCTNACTLGAKQCAAGGLQTCVMGSSTCTVWAAPTACGPHQSCTGVSGAAACTCVVDPSCASATDTSCDTNGALIQCGVDANQCFYVVSTNACPAHQTCTGSKPTASCDCVAPPTDCASGANSTFCATSTTVSTCKTATAGGKTCLYADTAVACGPHQSCATPSAGAALCKCNTDPSGCTAANTPSDSCGANNTSVHCALDGDNCPVGAVTQCNTHSTCSAGACQCIASICTTTGPTCNGGAVSTCAQDGACFYVSATQPACNAHSTCQGAAGSGACVCTAPTSASCTAAGTFCSGSGTQSVCQVDGTCPFTNPADDKPCALHQTCKGTGIGNACTCDDTCTAAQASGAGTYCTDGGHQASCGTDVGTSCHTHSAPVACVGIKTCQGADGAGSCQCPAAGMTAGTGCGTLNDTLCQNGTTVLTCVNDVASGCLHWTASTECSTSSLVCGTKSGVAACQCADNGSTDFYADPVHGTSATAGLFATGITSPEECRFNTLTAAVGAATTGGSRVIAATDAPPAIFASETFPLVVSTGVTLKTIDTTPTPSNYVIVVNSAGASAVSLLGGTTFEGFTIQNASGSASASAVSVTGTGVVVDTVALDGTGSSTLANGVLVNAGAVGTLNAVNIQSFTTGINIASGAGPSSLLTNGSLGANVTGIAISDGTLTATSTGISGGINGVTIRAAGGASSTFNASTFTVSGATAAGIAQSSTGGTVAVNLTTGDELKSNGASGLSVAAGTGTLGGVNIHDNGVAGIAQAGGALTLGSAGTTTVQLNPTGVTLTGGTLTVGTPTGVGAITNNTGNGVTASNSATLVSATGAQYTNNVGNGIAESAATLTFTGAVTGPILVSGNKLDGISMTDGNISANYLTVSSNGTGATKASGLELSGAPVVNIGVATDAVVSITGNGLNGVKVSSPTVGTAIDMRKASVTANQGDGVAIDLNWGTTADATTKAAFTSMTVSNNTGNGIIVTRAPALTGAVKLTFDSLTVASNGGVGVWFDGANPAGNDISASIKNSKIQLNTGTGLRFEEGPATATQETIQNDDITQNGGGGVVFPTSSTLVSFQGNTVHGNAGDQITVSARQDGAGNPNWIMRSIGNTCDANRNQVYCYQTGTGIKVNAGNSTTVDAENVNWTASAPGSGTDFITTGAAGNTVLVASPCQPPVTACP